jgi:hypothetical protein
MIDQNEDVYGRVRDGFEPVRMAGDLDAVTTRGGTLRRRRRVALPAGAGLAVVALAAAFNLPGGEPVRPAIELAAWSVQPEPDGTVTLTVRELFDPDGLESRLKEAGVASRVDFLPAGSPGCGGQREGLPALDEVMDRGPAPGVFHIDPSAMPAGTTLHFSAVATAGGTFETVRTALYEGEPPPC